MSTFQEWPAGTRVRCVDASATQQDLTVGCEYQVQYGIADSIRIRGYWFHRDRFKPLVRIKMGREIQP